MSTPETSAPKQDDAAIAIRYLAIKAAIFILIPVVASVIAVLTLL